MKRPVALFALAALGLLALGLAAFPRASATDSGGSYRVYAGHVAADGIVISHQIPGTGTVLASTSGRLTGNTGLFFVTTPTWFVCWQMVSTVTGSHTWLAIEVWPPRDPSFRLPAPAFTVDGEPGYTGCISANYDTGLFHVIVRPELITQRSGDTWLVWATDAAVPTAGSGCVKIKPPAQYLTQISAC